MLVKLKENYKMLFTNMILLLLCLLQIGLPLSAVSYHSIDDVYYGLSKDDPYSDHIKDDLYTPHPRDSLYISESEEHSSKDDQYISQSKDEPYVWQQDQHIVGRQHHRRQTDQPDNSVSVLSDESLLPFFPSFVDNVTVSHGRKAVLKCEVQNLRNYKVAWVRVDTQTILTIHNNVITRNPRISLSRPGENLWYLHINNVQETDRGWYMCQINTDPMVHKSGYLEVVVPPQLSSRGPSDMVVREGDNVSLSCDATGYPPPHIVWRREDGGDIILNGRKATIVERSSLELPKISRLNMGDYLCVASNGIPPSTSNKFSIKVQFPPMFWIPSQLEAAHPGQDVTLECHSEAFPKSINYWVNNKGAMLVSDHKYEAVSVESAYKVYMKLHIRNVTKKDYMEYRCVAKNSLGNSDGSITLYEIDPPTTPTLVTTTLLTTETTTKLHKRRKNEKGRHRKNRERMRETSRHSYEVDGEDQSREDRSRDRERLHKIHLENQRVRNLERDRDHTENNKDDQRENHSIQDSENNKGLRFNSSGDLAKISLAVTFISTLISLSNL